MLTENLTSSFVNSQVVSNVNLKVILVGQEFQDKPNNFIFSVKVMRYFFTKNCKQQKQQIGIVL